jgi:hypothetical protein
MHAVIINSYAGGTARVITVRPQQSMDPDPKALVEEFRKVAEIAGVSVPPTALTIEMLPAPHKPPASLPRGKMAVYVFEWKGQCLKVGKVGPNSQARYTSQHYGSSSSNSNLAKSVLAGREALGISAVSESNVGAWIKNNVDRTNYLLDAGCGIPVLTLLESFLQCRLRPRFEGFESQR